MELLFEKDGLPSFPLSQSLARDYGGKLGFDTSRVYANFVSSLDGVVALENINNSSLLISGNNEPDRFVMGLLRACADAVLIGAGTLRASPRSLWTAEAIYPDASEAFAELRQAIGRSGPPQLVVLTTRGELDPTHPAFETGALILTTESGATKLGDSLPSASTVVALGGGHDLDLVDVMARVRSDGHELVLAEGGPTVIGGLLKRGLLDEIFLTLSPILAGRGQGEDRPGLVEGAELLPDATISGELLSLRKHGSYLFSRYAVA
jgi:riboflavin biosynthesis pyrimidine reductase